MITKEDGFKLELFIKIYIFAYLFFLIFEVYVLRYSFEKKYTSRGPSLYALLQGKHIQTFVMIFLLGILCVVWFEALNIFWDTEKNFWNVLEILIWGAAGIFLLQKAGSGLQRFILEDVEGELKNVWLSAYMNDSNNLCRTVGSVYIFVLGLKSVKIFLKNKSAIRIAFSIELVYNCYAVIVTAFYLLFPFTNWCEISSQQLVIFTSFAPWMSFVFQLVKYIQYSSVFEKEGADKVVEMLIVLAESPKSTTMVTNINTPWSMRIDKDTRVFLKNTKKYRICADYGNELIDRQNLDHTIVIFTRFYNSRYYIDFAEEHFALFIYEYIYDTNINKERIRVKEAYYEQQMDMRELSCVESSLGTVLKRAVLNSDQITFREKLDEVMFQNINWRQLENTVFEGVIVRGNLDMFMKVKTFSLADLMVKYIESLNHCMTLIAFDIKDMSVNDVMRDKSMADKLRNATFGDWKDLRRDCIGKDSRNNIYDFSVQRYQSILNSVVSNSILEEVNKLRDELKKSRMHQLSNEQIMENLLLFRNYTRGHGIYTYEFTESLVLALVKIAVYLTNVLGELYQIHPIEKLQNLGWLYRDGEECYFLSSNYDTEYEFIEYSRGRTLRIDAQRIE